MSLFEKTEQLLKDGVKNNVFPCAAYAVGDRDGIHLKGFYGFRRVIMNDDAPSGVFCGTVPSDAPKLTADTLFDMASLSKVMSTTVIALRMIEDGMICLGDTVGRFFDCPADKSGINIQALMTHSSGLIPHIQLYNICKSPDEILNTILESELLYPTGTRVEYSCMGYILLGKILEKVSGKSLDTLAEEYVFFPLGMDKTGYNPAKNPKLANLDCVCEEYSPHEKKYIEGVVHDENARFSGGVSGNAGVFSTLDDVCRFAVMLSNKGVYGGKQIITSSMFEKAICNYTHDLPGEDRGLGFYISSHPLSPSGDLFPYGSYGHLGFTGNSLFVDPKTGVFAVLLTNRVHYTRQNDKIFRFRRLFNNCAVAEYLRMKNTI